MYILGQAVGNDIIISLSIIIGFTSYFFTLTNRSIKPLLWSGLLAVDILILLLNETYPLSRLVFNIAFFSLNILLLSAILNMRIKVLLVLRLVILMLFVFIITAFFIALIHNMKVYTYLDSVLVGFSYNYISGLLILAVSLYLGFYMKISQKPRFGKTISIISVMLCFLLYGRSGIAFSFLLALVACRDYINFKTGFRTFVVIVLLTCFTAFVVYNSFVIIDLIQNSKFKEGLQSPRSIMLSQYIAALNLQTLLLGVDITKIPLIASFNFNPHNSYLNLHAMSGLLGILFISLLIVMIFKISIHSGITAVYLFIYLGRGAIDTIIFPGVLDFIFLGILLSGSSWLNHYKISKVA